jgi:hypothetical protein
VGGERNQAEGLRRTACDEVRQVGLLLGFVQRKPRPTAVLHIRAHPLLPSFLTGCVLYDDLSHAEIMYVM